MSGVLSDLEVRRERCEIRDEAIYGVLVTWSILARTFSLVKFKGHVKL